MGYYSNGVYIHDPSDSQYANPSGGQGGGGGPYYYNGRTYNTEAELIAAQNNEFRGGTNWSEVIKPSAPPLNTSFMDNLARSPEPERVKSKYINAMNSAPTEASRRMAMQNLINNYGTPGDFSQAHNWWGQQQVKRQNKGLAPVRNKAMQAYVQGAVY